MARARIAIVGFLATAVTFGPGRMAYGMFLPQLKEDFEFGNATGGGIAGIAFASFFLSLFLTGWLTPRFGPRPPVLVGGVFATAGFALTAFAPGLVSMAIGVAFAASSAGFAWTPFNTMAKQSVKDRYQKRVLSIVSTGTTFGIIGAGLLALIVALSGHSWRAAWGAFSVMGVGVVLTPMLLLPKQEDLEKQSRLDIRKVLTRLMYRQAFPLYGLALSFGATNGTYLSYWIEHVSQSGGFAGIDPALIGPLLFVSFGLGGCLGLFTGDIEENMGLRPLLLTLFLSSAASLMLLACLPYNRTGPVVSAALQGVCLMALSAVYSFWSERLFPDIPSASFTAVLMLYAIGNVIAPPLAGLMSSEVGLAATFAIFGVLSLASLPLVHWVDEI